MEIRKHYVEGNQSGMMIQSFQIDPTKGGEITVTFLTVNQHLSGTQAPAHTLFK
jgi:hypothetical protein